ncbi:MAG: hypothetical protein KBT27_04955 [Prevotellaceae bacterium]|nr:hypothetical protein [Candidatus Faecinaster equi]
MTSYKNKILKIYFWQAIAFLLNFLSIFIVSPLLTGMPEIYGIYSVCVSLNIFLQYADFGFLDAGKKYAAEAYTVGDSSLEKKYLGTSMSIFAVMSVLVIAAFSYFAYNPCALISDIEGNQHLISIARKLILILIASIPIYLLEKFCQSIYAIRLEDFVLQRFNIAGSFLKILSVPIIFFNNKYDIVGYYAFCQVISLLCIVFCLIRSRKIGYGLPSVFNVISFDKEAFSKIKGLALSGFVSCLSWIVYFELDSIYISFLLGAKMVAIYTIGKNIQSFVRSIIGIFYSPYVVRFNYFVGDNDFEGLRGYFYNLVSSFSCIIFIPLLVIVLFAEPFVFSWVGSQYADSVIILQVLVLGFILNYFLSPAGAIVYSLNRVRDILILSILQPLIFLVGVSVTYKTLGINAFPIFKLLACIISFLYYAILLSKILKYRYIDVIKMLNLKSLILPSILCLVASYFINPFFQGYDKSSQHLLIVILTMGGVVLLSLGLNFLISKEFRRNVLSIIHIKR